jgi:hypothetical protein
MILKDQNIQPHYDDDCSYVLYTVEPQVFGDQPDLSQTDHPARAERRRDLLDPLWLTTFPIRIKNFLKDKNQKRYTTRK